MPLPPDTSALAFLQKHGFNFARIPADYRFWTQGSEDYSFNEEAFVPWDEYVQACRDYAQHVSLNIHRAPGYCINSNHLERHNLWLDEVAQDAFVALWEHMAHRYKGIPGAELSFDLVNEPPQVGQYGMTRDVHQAVIRRVVAAIWAIDPTRPIAIDGLSGGNLAMPELADLDVVQSGRGYQPMTVSHFRASWWDGSVGLPDPKYPEGEWEGKVWNRSQILDYYQPWRDLASQGVNVHIGEFGCYEFTPQDVALRWFADLFSVFKELKWGYSMWNFEGAFGIIGHKRPGAVFEEFDGYRVDRHLLDLMLESRASSRP